MSGSQGSPDAAGDHGNAAPYEKPTDYEDARYGVVRVEFVPRNGGVRVSGERVPTAEIRRTSPGRSSGPVFDDPPAGSWNADKIVTTVYGVPAIVRPHRGVMRRSTANVDATIGGRAYLLRQRTRREATVLRDGRTIAEVALERSKANRGNEYGPPQFADIADALDVSVTHLLAAGFQVGNLGAIAKVFIGVFGIFWNA